MKELMEFVNAPDLATRARMLLSLVDTADPCFIGLVVVLLGFVGAKMVAGNPTLQRWGLRLAAAVFLLYAGYGCYQAGSIRTEVLPGIGLRALIASGGVLAVTWIVLPVLAFIYRYIRVAAAASLVYAGYALVTAPQYNADELRGIGLRSLAVAGLAMVIAWIIQPVWDFLKGMFVKPGAEANRAPAPATSPAPAPSPRHTMLAPPAELPTGTGDEAQRRREQVRLQVELHYALVLPDGPRWPRAALDDFVRRHLGDQLPAEQVEENGQQLLDMLRRLPAQDPAPGSGLEELTRWYLEEQRRLLALDLDPEARQERLRQLHQQYLTRAEPILRAPLLELVTPSFPSR